MTKTVYIIRHGETDYNKAGIVQGSGVDAPLNELGHWQALRFFEKYGHINFDKVYTSTLQRTHQTAAHFINNNIAWQQHHGLNEINWGIREGRKPDAEDNRIFNEIVSQWNAGKVDVAFEGGESPQQVAQRQQLFIEEMLAQTHENTVLVAMHGRALKILMAHIIAKDLSQMDNFEHSNLCLYVLKYHYQSNTFELVTANDTEHLW